MMRSATCWHVLLALGPQVLLAQQEEVGAIPIPPRGKYSHGIKVEQSYDKLKDSLAVSARLQGKGYGGISCKLSWTPGCGRWDLMVGFAADGQAPRTLPAFIVIGLANHEALASRGGELPDVAEAFVLVGEERLRYPVTNGPATWSTHGDFVQRHDGYSLRIPPADFARMAAAPALSLRIGTFDFEAEPKHLGLLRDVASRMAPPGVTSLGGVTAAPLGGAGAVAQTVPAEASAVARPPAPASSSYRPNVNLRPGAIGTRPAERGVLDVEANALAFFDGTGQLTQCPDFDQHGKRFLTESRVLTTGELAARYAGATGTVLNNLRRESTVVFGCAPVPSLEWVSAVRGGKGGDPRYWGPLPEKDEGNDPILDYQSEIVNQGEQDTADGRQRTEAMLRRMRAALSAAPAPKPRSDVAAVDQAFVDATAPTPALLEGRWRLRAYRIGYLNAPDVQVDLMAKTRRNPVVSGSMEVRGRSGTVTLQTADGQEGVRTCSYTLRGKALIELCAGSAVELFVASDGPDRLQLRKNGKELDLTGDGLRAPTYYTEIWERDG